MSIHFTVPASAAAELQNDDERFVVSLIVTKFARREADAHGLVRLHAKYLADIMQRRSYATTLERMIEAEIIERFDYAVGSYSYGFRLHRRFVLDKHVRIEAADFRIIRRIEKFRDQEEAERQKDLKPVHRILERLQRDLDIDGDRARATLEQLPPKCNQFDCQGLQIAAIERKEFRLTVGNYGRVSNSITTMKRELRDSLLLSGERTGSVDIRNSQPTLLANLAQQHTQDRNRGRKGTIRREYKNDYTLSHFVSIVQSGRLYEHLTEKLQKHGLTRNEVKKRVLVDVLAKCGDYPSLVEDCFKAEFPTVHKFVKDVNRDNHAALIRRLQRAEAEFVIDVVCKDIVQRHPSLPILTLHDSVFAPRSRIDAVEQAFRRGFKAIDFEMGLHVDA